MRGVFRYKFILLYIVIVLIIRIVGDGESDLDAIEKENESFEASERRVMETFIDEDWHVAHLKETDFQEEDPVRTRRLGSVCLPETFAEKLKRYRRTLRNDAALIEFVSAQAIPVDESELIHPQCNLVNGTKIENITQVSSSLTNTSISMKSSSDVSEIAGIFPIMEYTGGNVQLEDLENKTESKSPVSKKVPDVVAFRASTLKVESKTEMTNDIKVNDSRKDSVNQTLLNTTIVPLPTGINTVLQSVHTQTEEISNATAAKKETSTASTTNMDKKSMKTLKGGPEILHQATPPKVKRKKKPRDSRRGEYMFSSHEYYDETIDFDISVCPDDVEETDLELDILRPYDVECELALEWSSLE